MDSEGYVESGNMARLRRLGGVFDLMGYRTISANDLVLKSGLLLIRWIFSEECRNRALSDSR